MNEKTKEKIAKILREFVRDNIERKIEVFDKDEGLIYTYLVIKGYLEWEKPFFIISSKGKEFIKDFKFTPLIKEEPIIENNYYHKPQEKQKRRYTKKEKYTKQTTFKYE